MNYFEIEIGDDYLFETSKEYVKGLLFHLKITNNNTKIKETYTVVTEDWREISQDKKFDFTKLKRKI